MSTLSGQKIKDKFGNLLQVEGGVTSSTKNVEDGTGDATALKLSTTEVEINGTQSFTAAPTTDNTEATALMIDGSNEVVKRELGTAAFLDEMPRIIARQNADRSIADGANTDMAFATVDNSDPAASFAQDAGGNYSFPTTERVQVAAAGVYRIGVSVSLINNTSNVNITTELRKNGTDVISAYRSKTATDDSMVSFFYALRLAANDYISVNISAAAGTTDLEAGSCLELHRIA